jgi:hypothetical protein
MRMKGEAAISLLGPKVHQHFISCIQGLDNTLTVFSPGLALGFLAGTLEALDKSTLRSDQGMEHLLFHR